MEFGIPHHHQRQRGFLIFVSPGGNPYRIKKTEEGRPLVHGCLDILLGGGKKRKLYFHNEL